MEQVSRKSARRRVGRQGCCRRSAPPRKPPESSLLRHESVQLPIGSRRSAQPAAGAGIGGQLCHTRDGRLPRERGSHDAQARLAQGHRCGRGCELPADLRIKSHARHEAELDQPLGFLIELPVPGSAAPSAAQTSVTAARKSSRFRAEDDSMIDLFGASTAKSVVPSSHSLDASSRPCQARFDEPGHCLVTVIGLP